MGYVGLIDEKKPFDTDNVWRNKKSVQEGLVDLLILSKTNIYQSEIKSTFLDWANYFQFWK